MTLSGKEWNTIYAALVFTAAQGRETFGDSIPTESRRICEGMYDFEAGLRSN